MMTSPSIQVTDEMIEAGVEAWHEHSCELLDDMVRAIYLAMSNSSPIMKEDVVEHLDFIAGLPGVHPHRIAAIRAAIQTQGTDEKEIPNG